uniref:RNA-dependent RNA polymerase n=1 Tax=Grapevine-associated botourmia-like virus 2 TaxID=2814346 RepID=A0A8F5MKW1_9VIRU|nr:MAG: RNA-dependent RNA polymerase [Grapevine-associated botourmia-like virus 2]
MVRPNNKNQSRVGENLSATIKKEKEYWGIGCTGLAECGCPDHDSCGCIFYNCGCPKSGDSCQKTTELTRKAQRVFAHLRKTYGIRAVRKLPPGVDCHSFRQSIRNCLPCDLTAVQELTVKTAAKIVRGCDPCHTRMKSMVKKYKKERFTKVDVVPDDIRKFKQALSMNVDQGWNKSDSAYIPNGHASLFHTRKQGGNWNEEEFRADCSVMAAFSSGKPRIVTLYSGYNSQILKPLHDSLYKTLRRKGWLLTGPPTSKKVQNLNGLGPYMSYDYEAATDNIKAAFVQAAVEVLREKGEGLTDQQSECLQVVAELRFRRSTRGADRGQPMGSLMSFPLLCLINKTIVDLALLDLLEKKEISFKEWTSHRSLINGDDLLMRSPTIDPKVYDRAHRRWGNSVGMNVNVDKTKVDEEEAEINSSLFVKGELVKKTNLSALYMSGRTDDVLRVAMEASTTKEEFRRMVRFNAHLLARQSIKFPTPLPRSYRLALLGCPRIRRALKAMPVSERQADIGIMKMEERPEGYTATPDEEKKWISDAVERARRMELWRRPCRSRNDTRVRYDVLRLRDAYNPKSTPTRELILQCCAQGWEEKRKQLLWVEECEGIVPPPPIVSDLPPAFAFLDAIRAWKIARAPNQDPLEGQPDPSTSGCDRDDHVGILCSCVGSTPTTHCPVMRTVTPH